MLNLSRRVTALEAKCAAFKGPSVHHLIGCPDGMSKAEGLAAFEARNGPVGKGDGLIYLVGIAPGSA